MTTRWITLVATLSVVTAACATAGFDDPTIAGESTSTSATTTSEVDVASTDGGSPVAGALPDGPSALDNMRHADFPPPLVDPNDIISGGPPPDGIPPIDAPVFVDVRNNIDLLSTDEPVVALEINGEARAYPVRVMIWHEIVNDEVGGVPVSVTYCPLCNSAVTYERTIRGTVTTFGTSGRLFASALVMYDRATRSLWTHYNGQAVVGVLTGEQLVEHPSPLLSWGDFVSAYPTGTVLDWRQTGFDRDYGENPYVRYDRVDGTPFLFRGALDDRAAAMQRVVGVDLDGISAAYSLEYIAQGDAHAVNTSLGGTPIAIFWTSGQSSALDTRQIAEGIDVGSAGVFRAEVDGRALTFDADGDTFVDAETGTRWSIVGHAVEGPLKGATLERVPHLDTFWFVWSTYQPATILVEG